MTWPTSQEDFDRLMTRVDTQLADEGVRIELRPHEAARMLVQELGATGAAATLSTYDPEEWYKGQYGRRVLIDFDIGKMIVLLRGDAWTVRFPLAFGRFVFLCTADPAELEQSVRLGPGLNVLDYVDELPTAVRQSLNLDEREALLRAFVRGCEAWRDLHAVRERPFVPEVMSDHAAAVHFLEGARKRHPGQSKWASLQATEKAFKTYLQHCNQRIPRTHELELLRVQAVVSGFSLPPDVDLGRIQCTADVRYGTTTVTLTGAVDAHHEAMHVTRLLATALRQP